MERPEPSAGSLATRAALAVGLALAFYVLSAALGSGLLLLGWYLLHLREPPVRIAVFSFIGGSIILWSIVPRPGRFVPPGPRLLPARHPRLFEEVREVARATDQPVPDAVYLVGDMNAAVAQVGGFLGSGGRRVMFLGLPLMALLRTAELRGVLCHEFGHFHSGDTKLGPWIWRTRESIGRTIVNLARAGSLLRFPFIAFGKAFLGITQAVSRRQELDADRLAAGVAGPAPLARGLRATQAGGQAYAAFLKDELLPVLSAGFRPPLAEGFRRFLGAPSIGRVLDESVRREIREGKGGPYDSHPPLGERLRALGGEDPGPSDPRDPPAISLLDDLDDLEGKLLPFMFKGPGVSRLEALSWEGTVDRVYLPLWRDRVRQDRAWLSGIRARDLPAGVRRRIAEGKGPRSGPGPSPFQAAAFTTGSALALCLLARGWRARVTPGEEVALEKGGRSFKPFAVAENMGRETVDAATWALQCAELGIDDGPLLAGDAA